MERPASPPTAPSWQRLLGERLGALLWLKAIGTPLAIGVFFVGYFWTLRNPQFAVYTMPMTALDRWLPFVPEALAMYASLWVYVSLAPALLRDRRELLALVRGAAVLAGVGLTIFFVWPTTVPVFEIDWAEHVAFQFMKRVDLGGNACPSLHVAFAVFAGLWIDRVLREVAAPSWLRALGWLWCAAIILSTVAVRQHVVLDVAAGVLLGAAVGVFSARALAETPQKGR